MCLNFNMLSSVTFQLIDIKYIIFIQRGGYCYNLQIKYH